MAVLTANRPFPNQLQIHPAGGWIVDMVMTVSLQIYEGSFVGMTAGTGTVRAIAASDSSVWCGIALKKVLSDATAGSTKVPVWVCGVFSHALASVAFADIGKVAFASDDNTLTLTSTNNSAVGRIIAVPATGTAVIQMKDIGAVAGAVGTTYTAGAL